MNIHTFTYSPCCGKLSGFLDQLDGQLVFSGHACAMSVTSGPPLPGCANPQAGLMQTTCHQMVTTKENILKFFNPLTYKREKSPVPPVVQPQRHEMITTRENIQRFFNPSTYVKDPCPQKRASSPSVPVKNAKMSKCDLLEKFKLAAELNGIDWTEMAVARLLTRFCFYNPFWVLGVLGYNEKKLYPDHMSFS